MFKSVLKSKMGTWAHLLYPRVLVSFRFDSVLKLIGYEGFCNQCYMRENLTFLTFFDISRLCINQLHEIHEDKDDFFGSS